MLALEYCFDSLSKGGKTQFRHYREAAAKAFSELLRRPESTDEIVLTHLIYLSSKYGIFYHTSDERVKTELLFLMDSDSLYLRKMALRCLVTIGDEMLVCKALLRLNENGNVHPFPLICEDLKGFVGNKKALADCISAHFSEYSQEMRSALTKYCPSFSNESVSVAI